MHEVEPELTGLGVASGPQRVWEGPRDDAHDVHRAHKHRVVKRAPARLEVDAQRRLVEIPALCAGLGRVRPAEQHAAQHGTRQVRHIRVAARRHHKLVAVRARRTIVRQCPQGRHGAGGAQQLGLKVCAQLRVILN